MKIQQIGLRDLFTEYRETIENGEEVSSSLYERQICEIAPSHKHDYHFEEFIAKSLHEEGCYEEVFETLYRDSSKSKSYLESSK